MLNEKIKKYRKERGMSQYALAKFLGISRSYIGDVERGRVKGSVNLVRVLVDKTGLDYNYWIDGAQVDEAPVEEFLNLKGLPATESMIKVIIDSDGYDPVLKKVLPTNMDLLLKVLEEEIKMKILIHEYKIKEDKEE